MEIERLGLRRLYRKDRDVEDYFMRQRHCGHKEACAKMKENGQVRSWQGDR